MALADRHLLSYSEDPKATSSAAPDDPGGIRHEGSHANGLSIPLVPSQETEPDPASKVEYVRDQGENRGAFGGALGGTPKGPLEVLKQEFAASRSAAGTPEFVRTAAEVADSAAVLDAEEPEAEISDEEAGKLGVRRLSSTPIPQVAITAAEVADSARLLDLDDVDKADEVGEGPRPLPACCILIGTPE